MKRILIIEDDDNICQLLEHLFQEKYHLTIAQTGTQGIIKTAESTFDLILLDLMLPEVAGESVLQRIRQIAKTPVIIMTALSDKAKTVELLKLGANDYVTKPFHIEELEARIEVQLRQSEQVASGKEFRYKQLRLNCEEHQAFIKDQLLEISNKEYQLLELLLRYPTKIYSKANLYEQIWGESYIGGENTLNVHISNLRKKLKQIDTETEYIETVWGLGIRLAQVEK